jgi:hypothetical protein
MLAQITRAKIKLYFCLKSFTNTIWIQHLDNKTLDHRIIATTAEIQASVTANASDKKEVLYKCRLCRFWHLRGVMRQPMTEQTYTKADLLDINQRILRNS